jgi:hypothetical protein
MPVSQTKESSEQVDLLRVMGERIEFILFFTQSKQIFLTESISYNTRV